MVAQGTHTCGPMAVGKPRAPGSECLTPRAGPLPWRRCEPFSGPCALSLSVPGATGGVFIVVGTIFLKSSRQGEKRRFNASEFVF